MLQHALQMSSLLEAKGQLCLHTNTLLAIV